MLLTMVFFGGWCSRFKLIRLRRISLATLSRYGLMDGAGVLHSQKKVSDAPPTATHKGGGRGMVSLI